MNSWNGIGRLTKDVEVRYTTTNNTLVATFTLAVKRQFAKEGQEQADFINIVAWGKTGEFASKYFKKGQQVGVTGRIQTRRYEDKDGKTVFVTEIIAEQVYFADSARGNGNGSTQENAPFEENFTPVTDDDLPF